MLFQNLKIFAQDIPTKYILLFIVIIGFLLRVNNLTIGFPILYLSNDEAIYHLSALNMLASKTPFTQGNYGPLGAYLQIPFLLLGSLMLFLAGKVHSVGDIEFLLLTQEGYFLFIPRIISALFGTLGILAIYSLSKDLLRNKSVALWSAFLFAISFNLVHISHLGRGWAPAIFFAMLATKFALFASREKKGSFKNSSLAFVLAAVAFGFHQLSGLIIFLLLFLMVAPGIKSRKFWSKERTFGLILFLLMTLFFNWLSLGGNFLKVLEPQNPTVGLINFPPLSSGLSELLKFYNDRGIFWELPKNLILSDGVLVFLLFVYLLKAKSDKVSKQLLIFIVFNYLLVVFILPVFVRYLLVSIALMPIFAGWSVNEFAKKKQFAVVIVIVLSLSFNSVYWNLLLLKKPTFDQFRQWLDTNVAQETAIAALNVRNIGYVPSTEAADIGRMTNPGSYRRSSNVIGDAYPDNVRNIIYFDQLKSGTKAKNAEAAIKLQSSKYVIDWYFTDKSRLIYTNSNYRLVAHFSPTGSKIEKDHLPEILTDAGFAVPLIGIDRAGPYFDVLELQN